MAAKPYEFHPEARIEVRESGAWYAERDLLVSDRFYQESEQAVQMVGDLPDTFPQYLHGTRRYLLHDFPFPLVYREKAGVIQLIALAHHRRRPEYWKKRAE